MMSRPTVIHPTAEVSPRAEVGPGSRVWQHCIVLAEAKIGARVKLAHNVFVESGVVIGDDVTVKDNVALYDGVTIEDQVFIGPGAVFTNVLTPRAFVDRKAEFGPTLVRRGATIGANATVLCGVTIGRYAMVGAGAVVTKGVLDHALVVGNPARRVGWVSRTGERLDPLLVCPRTGERYRETDKGLVTFG